MNTLKIFHLREQQMGPLWTKRYCRIFFYFRGAGLFLMNVANNLSSSFAKHPFVLHLHYCQKSMLLNPFESSAFTIHTQSKRQTNIIEMNVTNL